MKQAWMVLMATLVAGAALAQDPAPSAIVSVKAASGSVQLANGVTVAEGASAGVNNGEVITVDGSAQVTYSTGCVVAIANQQYTINTAAPCPSNPNTDSVYGLEATHVAIGLAAIVGIGLAVGGSDDDNPSSP